MRSRLISYFTMVEIVMAVGFLVIGIMSTMALFPVGLEANRDSAAESYAADSADQFLHWYAARAKNDWTTYTSAGWLPTSKSTALTGDLEDDDWEAPDVTGTNVTWEKHASANGLFRLKFARGSGADEMVDFSGVYRFWQGTVDYSYWDPGTSSWQPGSVNASVAVAINLEASWPAELPYSSRRKAVYRLEIFKP